VYESEPPISRVFLHIVTFMSVFICNGYSIFIGLRFWKIVITTTTFILVVVLSFIHNIKGSKLLSAFEMTFAIIKMSLLGNFFVLFIIPVAKSALLKVLLTMFDRVAVTQ
jgi:hypothetical protein